jgi:hypothetical protein
MYEYGTFKPNEVILRRWIGKSEKNGGNEQSHGTLFAYVKISHRITVQLIY